MNKKHEDLKKNTINTEEPHALTTNQGLKMAEDEFSLKAGERGPTLLEDFHFREKMTHFDHERIPERVVHARGFAAHGEFELYESLEKYTKADFLNDTSKKTPVFVRFSTVAGNRGSADTPRDTRGFATKFYTDEGNFDLVGNNIPVFFIQDAIKFPDVVHAVKPEQHNEIPQAASAHDTFWDFFSQNPESTHHTFWNMSDRALPRSLRMMEGFGVHTFRLINAEGVSHFVKFHWKPVLGTHGLVWDESQIIMGKDADFQRRDIWDNIENGNPVEFELGFQIIEESQEFDFDFDILDPTKLWPEEEVPVKIVGKMTLNRNVENYFAETEQVAFHPGHLVPGIDFSNDPLLQGRLFSYTDTQLIRLGGPNFHQIPINRPVCPFANNQREGYNQMHIHKGQTSYHKNALNNNQPEPVPEEKGGFEHYHEKIDAHKVRARSESFKDHYSQAKMFYKSLSPVEQKHVQDAFTFELNKCKVQLVKDNAVAAINNVDRELAEIVADGIGAKLPAENNESKYEKVSPALSMLNTKFSLKTRKIGVYVNDDAVDSNDLSTLKENLESKGLQVDFLSDKIKNLNGVQVNETFDSMHSTLYDSIIIVASEALQAPVVEQAELAFKHKKAIGVKLDNNINAFERLSFNLDDLGVTNVDSHLEDYLNNVANHRVWERK